MGKKDKGVQVLGRCIIKERFAKKRPLIGSKGDTFLHTSDLQDGYNWGRLNLMSVTEQSNLEDFLATAEMAGTEFTAEKLNVKFIDRLKDSGLPSGEELKRVKEKQEKNKKLLRIPRRPKWDCQTSADELSSRERECFLQWRKGLAYLQEEEELMLTPYEKNLDFWRQLWRVIERSDVIVQIVDARNPLLFRCKDLELYVKEVDPNKVNVILINKADFLSYKQRKEWAIYFGREGVRVAFWSALHETERQEQLSRLERDAERESTTEEFTIPEKKDEKPETDLQVEETDTKLEEKDDKVVEREEEGKEMAEEVAAISGEASLDAALNSLCLEPADSDEEESETSEVEDSKAVSDDSPSPDKTKSVNFTESSKNDEDEDDPVINSSEVLDAEGLLEFFKSLHTGPKVRENTNTIGMVGYPNVGKSSTINAILRTKKVPVSATPGRTKHFQTLYVEKYLILCDCPGLVFPSFVSTKAELIVNGILPIDQMKDHVPPTSLVCERIPRQYLEDCYGIMIPPPGDCEDPERPPTALELLYAYGYMRGFMTPSSVPDCPRSSRYILKDYVNGKLLFCQSPPGIDGAAFQEVHGSKKKENAAPKKEFTTKGEKLDFDFFLPSKQAAHSIGSRSVKDYVRLKGLKQVGSSVGENETKPSKKHHKKKKDKLRRIYSHLDQH